MGSHYNDVDQQKARRWWLSFSFINIFALQFLAGNVIILFIIRLNASKTLVGLVSSYFYLSYLIMPVGRLLSRKIGIVRGFVVAWFTRYFTIVPVIVAPLVVLAHPGAGDSIGIWMVVWGYLPFQLVRGVGMVSFSPVLTEVSQGLDRGKFLSQSGILTNLAILLGSLAVAFFLGEEAPLIRYFISFVFGVSLGLFGVYCLSRIPEIKRPDGHVDHGLVESMVNIAAEKKFRSYFLSLMLVGMIIGILRPFILVYVKDIYEFSDSNVLFLTVAGSLGAIFTGIISRKFLDRLGAKPMLVMWLFLMLVASAAAIIFRPHSGLLTWLYLIVLFFVAMMGLNGATNTVQAYFFGMVTAQQQVSYGIIFFLVTGFSGMLGSTSAGILLDYLQGPAGMDVHDSQRILFASIMALLVMAIVASSKIERLGALSLKRALSELFGLSWRTRN